MTVSVCLPTPLGLCAETATGLIKAAAHHPYTDAVHHLPTHSPSCRALDRPGPGGAW
ncbi:hypothetical protein [Streptomyces sp. NPDC017890]|uniref:hypothetical protein n=1 Tax=Streptomyces sp. NPDC017890 TaxID=3365015 RepID=UPI003796F4C1